jgi:hypothetical protein
MPETPAWAARAALYVVVGCLILFGLPFVAWLGRREVSRWESELEEVKQENGELRDMVKELRRDLMIRISGDHSDVEQKLDKVLEEVES